MQSSVIPANCHNIYTAPLPHSEQSGPSATNADDTVPTRAEDAQGAAPPPPPPSQFTASLLNDLLNFQQVDSSGHPRGIAASKNSAGASVTISSSDAPDGLDLSSIDAAQAAKEMIETAGSNGQLSLADAQRFLGVTKPDGHVGSPYATLLADWSSLTNGADGPLSESKLTEAIQGYLDASGPTDRPASHLKVL